MLGHSLHQFHENDLFTSAAAMSYFGLMALFPDYAHFIFGVVSAACFFFPGLKYYRQRWRGIIETLRGPAGET